MTPLLRSLHSLLVALVLLPVVIYRRVLSPLKGGPSCIYLPTCSEYALEAVKTRGIVVGLALATARLLRCNPLFHGGYHPVPRARSCAHAHGAAAPLRARADMQEQH